MRSRATAAIFFMGAFFAGQAVAQDRISLATHHVDLPGVSVERCISATRAAMQINRIPEKSITSQAVFGESLGNLWQFYCHASGRIMYMAVSSSVNNPTTLWYALNQFGRTFQIN